MGMRPALLLTIATGLLLVGCSRLSSQGEITMPGYNDPATSMFVMPDGVVSRWASHENPRAEKGRGGMVNQGGKGAPYFIIEPGESVELMVAEGPGVVRRIWMTLDEMDPLAWRELRLEMTWDGASTPAVSVPLGDFFGAVHGHMEPFENAFFSTGEGRSLNCYIPMPFRESARIVLHNDAVRDARWNRHRVFYDVNFTLGDDIPESAGYFHATWRRENPTELAEDFEILPRLEGRGRFLGCHIGVLGLAGNPGWWGEGETKIFLDGDTDYATLVGTGTEDYIGSAWGQGRFINRYQGAYLADYDAMRHAFYRFHVPDPVYFDEDIRVTIQQMGGALRDEVAAARERGVPMLVTAMIGHGAVQTNLLDNPQEVPENFFLTYFRRDDVCAVAYFYLDRPENALPPLAPVEERLAPRFDTGL